MKKTKENITKTDNLVGEENTENSLDKNEKQNTNESEFVEENNKTIEENTQEIVETSNTKEDVPVCENELEDKKNKQRKRIDKLLNLKNMKYRGILTGRIMKILGFVLLFLAQVYLCLKLIGKFTTLPDYTTTIADIFETLSFFSLPLFLTANFCVILTRKANIKKMLLTYLIIALGIYLFILFIFFRYLMGVGKYLSGTTSGAYEFADLISKKLFGKVINYNVFIDLTLFTLFYFFLFYVPKKIKSKKGIILFRCLGIIPAIIAVASTVLYGLYNLEIIELSTIVLSILPCRSITIYFIFFGIVLVAKLRQHLFFKWGGTEEEYKAYTQTNRSSLEISLISSIIILIVSAIDFALLMINPWVLFFGMGINFYLAFTIPLIMLLSTAKPLKPSIWDIVMIVVFIFAVIILYLETGLFIIKNV